MLVFGQSFLFCRHAFQWQHGSSVSLGFKRQRVCLSQPCSHGSHGVDAEFFCSPFPVHSPCTVDGRDIMCPDARDESPSLWTAATIGAVCGSVALFAAAVAVITLTVRSMRRRRASPATEMRASLVGAGNDDETASLMEPDFVSHDDDLDT